MAAKSSSLHLFKLSSIWVLLIVADLLCFCASDPRVACNMPSVEKGQMATLTCDFGVDMQKKQSEIYVERTVSQRGKEDILDCQWRTDQYTCDVFLPQFSFRNDISHKLTMHLPAADEGAEGTYYCKAENQGAPVPCNFSLKDHRDTSTEVNEWFVVSVMLIVLVALIIVLFFAMWCCFPDKSKTGIEKLLRRSPRSNLGYNPVAKDPPPQDQPCSSTDKNNGATINTSDTTNVTTTPTTTTNINTNTTNSTTNTTTDEQQSGKRKSDRSSGGKSPGEQPKKNDTVEKQSPDKVVADANAEHVVDRAQPINIHVNPAPAEGEVA